MKTTVFDEWIIECDEWITASAYSKISCGSAQECGCDDCQLFVKLCPSIFPRRVRDLLEGLGIDLKKEKEVSEFGFGRARPGMNLYIAEYDFYGKLLLAPMQWSHKVLDSQSISEILKKEPSLVLRSVQAIRARCHLGISFRLQAQFFQCGCQLKPIWA